MEWRVWKRTWCFLLAGGADASFQVVGTIHARTWVYCHNASPPAVATHPMSSGTSSFTVCLPVTCETSGAFVVTQGGAELSSGSCRTCFPGLFSKPCSGFSSGSTSSSSSFSPIFSTSRRGHFLEASPQTGERFGLGDGKSSVEVGCPQPAALANIFQWGRDRCTSTQTTSISEMNDAMWPKNCSQGWRFSAAFSETLKYFCTSTANLTASSNSRWISEDSKSNSVMRSSIDVKATS